MVAPSKRNCRIAQRIARTPKRARGAHTRSSCSRNVTVWQVVSRHIQRRIVPPEPCRDPGPGRVDDLHDHAPVALCDHPTTRAASTAITGLYVEHQTTLTSSDSDQMEAHQTDEQIMPITTIKRHGAAGRVRRRPRSCEDRGGRSPLIIKDLDVYPQPPTNTHSPTLNSEEPVIGTPCKNPKYSNGCVS